MTNDAFSPRTISRERSTSSLDCLSEFAQLADGAWWLPVPEESTNVTAGITTFADCVALCPAGSTCQLVTYDYLAKTCTVRYGATVIMVA